MNTSFSLVCVSAILLMMIGLVFAHPLLVLFGASDTSMIYAYPYMMIYLTGTLPSMIAIGMNPFINAQGYSLIGMLSVAIGALTNLILDPVFIFLFGLGVRGAAIATVLSQCLSAMFVLFFLMKKAELKVRFLHRDELADCRGYAQNIVSLGTSGFIMQLTNSLVTICCNNVLSVVGGGGKTSLIFRMMEELTAAGKKVLITTTTHMAYEPDRPFAEDGDMISIKQNLEEYGYTIAASLDREKHKIGALSEEKLKEIKVLADVILIEADGAKRLPLKVPEEWEPVIPELVDLLIGVVGMDALGEPIQKTCHRVEKVAKFLGKGIEETVTEDDIVEIAVSRDGLRKCVDEREYRVLLNKADIPGKAEAAERIAGKLEQQRVHVVWGSLQKEYYNSCDFAREKITLVMLAAGNSRRFGSNKLLYEIDGMPMYLRTLAKLQKAASELGDCEIIVVTQYEEIAAKANTLGVKVLINPQPERGISSSMQIGLATAKDSSACLFTVSDQPWLTAETIINLVDKFRDEQKGMACTIFGTKTGNPCIFSREYYQELMEITGDKGGKQIINRHPEDVTYFKIEDARELQDIDIPLG